MRYIRFTLLTAAMALTACAKSTPSHEAYLRCSGSVGVLGVGRPSSIEDQVIAARVAKDVISFSGNSLFLDASAAICTTAFDGGVLDGSYIRFDSESCVATRFEENKRTYGTYNWVLGKLQLSQASHAPQFLHLQATFDCEEVNRPQ
jgi:hypothetical protein